MPAPDENVEVWIDQDLCTGDGLCAQLAPEIFRIHIDGLAYVLGPDGEVREEPGARVTVPARRLQAVWESARDCPGTCIYVAARREGQVVGGGPSNPDGLEPATE